MTTRDYSSLKKPSLKNADLDFEKKYTNFNLNQNHKCLSVDYECPKKVLFDNKRKYYEFNADCNSKQNNGFKSENLFSNLSSNLIFDKTQIINVNQWKGKKYKSSINGNNSSTLSLHITAYENTSEISSNAESKNSNLLQSKCPLSKKWKNAIITISTPTIQQNSLEFPRQQEAPKNEPENMQFKASQKLLHPVDKSTVSNNGTKEYTIFNNQQMSDQRGEVMSDLYKDHNLTDEEISRYGRQMITADYNVNHQENLKKSAVLVVGCGGLGNPLALYLAGAGIGKLGLVDFDTIDISNIHRQIGFTSDDVGKKKTEVLKDAILARNPNVEVEIYNTTLNKDNAMEIVNEYTVVADCSDNMPTRYTVNEACLITHTPLAMGSAVGWAGQFTFYHIDPKGPCYRCLYPNPSKNTINMSCNEKGIMGPVVGIVGNIQAIEIIKFCAFGESSYSDTMYNYDAFDGRFFNVKLRPKSPNCESCLAGLTQVNDYQMLCDRVAGQTPLVEIIPEECRVTSHELSESLKNDQDAVLIDVRPINEFKIAHHPRATNIPINEFSYEKGGLQTVMHLCKKSDEDPPSKCYLICRRGNDSYRVLLLLKSRFYGDKALDVVDVIGGYDAWRKDVDPNFPVY